MKVGPEVSRRQECMYLPSALFLGGGEGGSRATLSLSPCGTLYLCCSRKEEQQYKSGARDSSSVSSHRIFATSVAPERQRRIFLLSPSLSASAVQDRATCAISVCTPPSPPNADRSNELRRSMIEVAVAVVGLSACTSCSFR